jgi:hypothetical protein
MRNLESLGHLWALKKNKLSQSLVNFDISDFSDTAEDIKVDLASVSLYNIYVLRISLKLKL